MLDAMRADVCGNETGVPAMSWVEDEKASLVATLRAVAPEADTLCEGWDVRRLLAHLVQREQGPVAMIRDSIANRPPGQEPGLSRLADRAGTPQGYAELVSRFDAGPPPWAPMGWAGGLINLLEYAIHHEDIRRAGPASAEPRVLPAGQQQAVWKQAGLFARLGFRSAPVGVQLATPAGATRVAKKGPGVTLTGEPVELALYASGRRAPARVTVTGAPDAVESFTQWAAAA